MHDKMFELGIFKESKEESDAERIARQKREVVARIPKKDKIPFKFSLKGIPFVGIFDAMIINEMLNFRSKHQDEESNDDSNNNL